MVTSVEERWQANIKNLSDGIQYIYDTKEFADVTFFVRGKPIKAHKLVLASRSPRLARIVMSHTDTDEIVVPQNITENGFELFLSFVYTNRLNTFNKNSVVEAYQCAKYYEQKALESKCLEKMESWKINVKDACELMGLEVEIPSLREKCISFIQENRLVVVASEPFANASERAMTNILASDALEGVPDLQLIESVMKWGKQYYGVNDADYSRVRQKLLNSDPPLLGKLGIKNLRIEEFPKLLKNYPKLLTEAEISQLILYYGTGNSDALPSWCTSN